MNSETQHDWSWFKGKVRDTTGLDLTQYKANQLDRRLEAMAHRSHSDTPEQFWLWLNTEAGRMRPFLDGISINVSELLRNPEKWQQLQSDVLPILLREGRGLKVWSAGASYGAEAFSIATLLAEIAPDRAHRIIGTDIDHAILEKAKDSHFAEAEMKNVDSAWRAAHFELVSGVWAPGAHLRKMVEFRRHDLLRDPFQTGFDLICCRNVVIYFNDDAKERLYRKFLEALKPGGFLFVGSTERIVNGREMGFESPFPFFYRRPTKGGLQWPLAS